MRFFIEHLLLKTIEPRKGICKYDIKWSDRIGPVL